MRNHRQSFQSLVDKNRQQLLRDQKALDKIEEKLDEKYIKKFTKLDRDEEVVS